MSEKESKSDACSVFDLIAIACIAASSTGKNEDDTKVL